MALVSLLGFSPAAHASISLASGGTAGGVAYCDYTKHTIGIVYTATPGIQEDPTSTLGLMKVVPEWVEVWAYVKPHSSTLWGSPVAHAQTYVDRTTTLISTTRYGTPNAYYDVAFYVRAAFPGGQWTGLFWDLARLKESYSGSVFAEYGYCRT
jgi:hypothetical protein